MRSTTKYVLGALIVLTAVRSGSAAAQGSCEPCNEARSLYTAGKCREAIPILNKAVKAAPDSSDALSLQVLCQLQVDERKKAVAALDKLLALRPPLEILHTLRSAVANAEPATPLVELEFDVPEGAEPPVLVLYNRPVPSAIAREFRAPGDVVIEGLVGSDGKFAELEERRTGDWSRQHLLEFGDAAITSLRGWRYFPALKDGQPIAVKMRALVEFPLIPLRH